MRHQSSAMSSRFFLNDTPTTEIYTRKVTLSLHDALPISSRSPRARRDAGARRRSCSRRRRSEEHTSELQSPFLISYAVFCLKKKTHNRSVCFKGYNHDTGTCERHHKNE